MNKLRIALVSFFISLPFIPCFGQIRDFVPIVRPVYAEGTISYLNKLSDSLKKEGYTEASDAIKEYASGGFGSGFLVAAPDGKYYVITNRHVIAQAESVTLEFERPDGSQSVFRNCQILAIGETLDLAIIAPPAGSAPFTTGLDFASASLKDGMEVWTAGYPALGNTPGWQLGKGNVTNSTAKIPELVDPAITSLIQHSAQVDSGNSGGPLLVEDKTSKAGYKVIGINTWKATGRQATNLAIPSSAIRSFLEQTLSTAAAEPQSKRLETRCRGFINAMSKTEDPYKTIAEFISYSFVARDGEKMLKEALSTAPSKIRNEILGTFIYYSPIEGIRLAIAYKIQMGQAAQGTDTAPSFVAIDGDADNATTPVPVRFSLQGKDVTLSWIREHGLWRLSDYPFDAFKSVDDKNKKAISSITFNQSPYTALLSLGYDPNFANLSKSFWDINVVILTSEYFGFGLQGAFRKNDAVEAFLPLIIQPSFLLRLQLPMMTDKFSFTPYTDIGAGFIIDDSYDIDGINILTHLNIGAIVGFDFLPNVFAGIKYTLYSNNSYISYLPSFGFWVGFGAN
jgi:serine protease Do